MAVYFTWGAIGILVLALVIGFVIGLSRGLKRSSLHFIFLIVSFVLAFFITKPITNAILGISINYNGSVIPISQIIVKMVGESFDISGMEAATSFMESLPMAIAAPILFIVITIVCYFVFDIIYLIVARLAFGKKKKDFEKNKPRRAYGGIIGMVEGFLFLFVVFAPITSLTNTYQEILGEAAASQVRMLEEPQNDSNKMKTFGEIISEAIPKEVNEAILAYNNSVIGKIAGAGGLDNALFDGLSSFKVNNEKINFRQEIINFTNVYDEVAVVYNSISDKDFENIDLTNLKAEIETFLNNGLFKTVITDTIDTVVVKFDDFKADLGLENLPELAQDIIEDLHERFTTEGFDVYEYLKADILNLVDAADAIFKYDLISKFSEPEANSLEGILNVINENNEAVKTVAQDLLQLNIVKDAFEAVGEFGSQKLSEALENEKDLEIALNVDIADKDRMIADVLEVVTEISALLDKIDLFEILSAENPIAVLTDVENVKETLEEVGIVLDDVRELELLTLPAKEGVRDDKVYVLDNILEIYNVKLLGDVVHENPYLAQSTTLDSYEDFFKFIATPIQTAKDVGLFEIETKGFEEILDEKILPALRTDNEMLSEILTPFYQLQKASFDVTNTETPNIKSMIFDLFIKTISDNVEILDIESVKAEAGAAEATLSGSGVLIWHNELTSIGTTLDLLNNGEISIEGTEGVENKTYLEYMLMQDADMFNLLKEMLADVDDELFANVLDELFSAKVFGNLKTTIFTEIDKKIGEITGVVPQTDLTNLEATKAQTISTIESLLDIFTDETTNIDLEVAGKILDLLKVNAYNDATDDQTANGTKDGVFNNIFANLVWYMTSDVLSDVDYTGKTPYEMTAGDKAYLDVKAYLNVENSDEYYTINYAEKFAELKDVIAFSDRLMTALEGKTLDSTEEISQYLAAVKTVIDAQIEDTSRAEALVVIENTSNFLTNKGVDLLGDKELNTKYAVKAGIEQVYSEDVEIATALKKLLGVNDLPEMA